MWCERAQTRAASRSLFPPDQAHWRNAPGLRRLRHAPVWASDPTVVRLTVTALVLALSLGLAPRTCAQVPVLRFSSLTTANGLSHDMVYAITQDRQGFMWFGTQDGLNRYDGYTFTAFRHLRSDPHSLAHNTVRALAVDSLGFLWVGTPAGLDRFDSDTSRFSHYPEVAEQVTAIYEDRNGTLWVGTAGLGLFRYDRSSDRFLGYASDLFADGHILAIHQDRLGTLWVGTEYGGLYAVKAGEVACLIRHYRHDPFDPGSLPYDRITAIAEDEAGHLWIGTGAYHEPKSGGLACLNPTEAATANSGPSLALYRDGLPHGHITAIVADRAGTLWVGTEDGLAVLDRAAGQLTTYQHDVVDSYSLTNDRVQALYEDRSGILWIATDGGVSRYVREKNRFTLYRHDPRDPASLGAPTVGAVLKDRDGALWVGFHTGGLDRLDASSRRITHFRHDPANPNSLSHDHVTALCQDHSGRIWVGTDAGLDYLDPATGRFGHFAHDPANPRSIGPGAVKVIVEDGTHNLWIGTEEPGTLSMLNLAEGSVPPSASFVVYQRKQDDPTGFPDTYGIRAILEDRNGDLWLGTYSGLVHLDRHRGLFRSYRHDASNPASLSDDFVWALYQDSNGALWVGTQSGLSRLDAGTDAFTIYTVEDGLPNDGIAAILSDDAGALWLATMGGGLSRFDPHMRSFRNYDVSDGLQGMHFIPGAACRSSGGELFFGGVNGLNSFNPASIRENHHIPPIVLTAFRCFDKAVSLGRDLANIEEISLSYQDSFFSLEFAALDYADPVKNRYAYILEGFDRDWISCGTRHYVAYTRVPPGTYTFRVKGSNNDGIWNEEGLSVRLVIAPPFWQTRWFRAVAALGALGVASTLAGARMRQVARLRRSEERFRTLFENAPLGVCEADLTQEPARLITANAGLGSLFGWPAEALAGTALPDLFAPASRGALEYIVRSVAAGDSATTEASGLRKDGELFPVRLSAAVGPNRNLARCILVMQDLTAERARRSEEEAIAEERRRIAREIHDGLAQDLAAMRLQVRRWQTLIESAPDQLRDELEDLHRYLGEEIREVRRAIFALRPVALDELGFWAALRRFLPEFGEQNQLHINLEVKGAKDGTEEAAHLPAHLEAVLFRIIQEGLHNVAKHARASVVWVELDLSEGVTLRVRDDGAGFDPGTLGEAVRRGHLGLRQMRERAAALNGTLEVRSQVGRGTEICVRFAQLGRRWQGS